MPHIRIEIVEIFWIIFFIAIKSPTFSQNEKVRVVWAIISIEPKTIRNKASGDWPDITFD